MCGLSEALARISAALAAWPRRTREDGGSSGSFASVERTGSSDVDGGRGPLERRLRVIGAIAGWNTLRRQQCNMCDSAQHLCGQSRPAAAPLCKLVGRVQKYLRRPPRTFGPGSRTPARGLRVVHWAAHTRSIGINLDIVPNLDRIWISAGFGPTLRSIVSPQVLFKKQRVACANSEASGLERRSYRRVSLLSELSYSGSTKTTSQRVRELRADRFGAPIISAGDLPDFRISVSSHFLPMYTTPTRWLEDLRRSPSNTPLDTISSGMVKEAGERDPVPFRIGAACYLPL
ncbi:hypothetical protein BDK51DRAFT_41677 [Blyttiomyces helicus]|uniref:Uncharacterized protein n=1 Tax=Blyttiomyces helicus TaxID=388810 RepID=A0A4P9W0K9_9FUNG|nr:hypothetical protein BDK51DRAFT_41677 [Blyttiomyces helicus]|eukprot:RKO84080.1 hypothetical protein BDK51DRAFT_41677 [Blyttiomyces helicus]